MISEHLINETVYRFAKQKPFIKDDNQALLLIQGDKIIYGNPHASRLLFGTDEHPLENLFLSLFFTTRDLSLLFARLTKESSAKDDSPLPLKMRVDHDYLPVLLQIRPWTIGEQSYYILSIKQQPPLLQTSENQNNKDERLMLIGTLSAQILHEVRNPLTSIKGFIQLLAEQPGTSRHYLQLVRDEIDYMETLTTDILSFVREPSSTLNPIDLHSVIEKALILFTKIASEKQLLLSFSSDADLHMIEGNAGQIKQVLINIIKNAIEATPAHGTITLTLSSHGTTHHLQIKDTGVGIPEHTLEQLGNPFFTTKVHGTGLGIAICQQIMHSHHGQLRVQSIVDQGTTVSLIFPSATCKQEPAH
ncbi:MAG: ATP-binding protein [Sporolactobacillus sp.]